MARFLLLVSPRAAPDESPTELGARTARFMQWVARGREAGIIREGARVSLRAATITNPGSGVEALGAKAPPVERIAGYFIVEADTFVAAIAIARECPAADPGWIRVLELDHGAAIGFR